MRMREAGRNACGCNCAIRCLNAYLKWSGSLLKIPKLKEPQTAPATFSAEQVTRLVKWKPHSRCERRLHLLVLLLLDTGARITEALNLRVKDAEDSLSVHRGPQQEAGRAIVRLPARNGGQCSQCISRRKAAV